jgi:hypothetical protein
MDGRDSDFAAPNDIPLLRPTDLSLSRPIDIEAGLHSRTPPVNSAPGVVAPTYNLPPTHSSQPQTRTPPVNNPLFFTLPFPPQTPRIARWGFDPSDGTPTVLGRHLEEQSAEFLSAPDTLAQRWKDEKKLEVRRFYNRFLDYLNSNIHNGIEYGSIVDTIEELPNPQRPTEDELEAFIKHCMIVARTIVVSPPSHPKYPDMHQKWLATMFSYHPRLEIYFDFSADLW